MLIPFAVGCTSNPPAPATQPAVASDDFERLWDASARAMEDFHFTLDRQDRRSGTLTTVPMIGAQWFEPWRQELRGPGDVAESSLGSIRRTVVIDIEPPPGTPGATYRAVPKVIVERQSLAERRITNVASFRNVFRRSEQFGTREADVGNPLPRSYWYSTGTDAKLERAIADKIQSKLPR